MSKQTVSQYKFEFAGLPEVVVEAREVRLNSDAGLIPIREFDEKIGYTKRFTACLRLDRDGARRHSAGHMARQRIYGMIAGYEDCKDHDGLSCGRFFFDRH